MRAARFASRNLDLESRISHLESIQKLFYAFRRLLSSNRLRASFRSFSFFVSELAVFLELSREMGALVAGVSLSTFPYALDVTAKVTALRDFFITLFFVALGMLITLPTAAVIGLALLLVVFTLVSRAVTVVPPLYALRQGLRTSIVPAINLAQISEFSLVLIQVGVQAGQITAQA